MSYKFDDLLEELGGFGKYQKKLLYRLFSCNSFIMPIITSLGIYMVFTPDHWCNVQGREKYNVSLAEWNNITIPWEKGPDGLPRLSQCKIYEWSPHVKEENITTVQLRVMAAKENPHQRIIDCPETFGWTFDESLISKNLITDFKWICNRSTTIPFSILLLASSQIIGTAIVTPLADRFGRKLIFYLTLPNAIIGNILVAIFVSSTSQYLLVIFLLGIFFPEPFQLIFVLVMEYILPNKRSYANFVSMASWSVGSALAPLIGWLTKGNWRLVMACLALIHASMFMFFWCFKESPRWLIVRGRTDQALAIMKIMSKENRKSVPEYLEIKMEVIQNQEIEDEKDSFTLKELLKWKKVVLRMILLIIVWTAFGFIYHGVQLNLINLAGDIFLNSFIMALVEFPSFIICWLLLDRIGRRWTSFVALFASSICLFLATAVPPGHRSVVVVLSTLARSGGSMMHMVIFMYSAELAPTTMRSFGVGFPSGMSGLLLLSQAYIVHKGKQNLILPFLIMGVTSAVGAVLVLFLPETANQDLPQTLEEANGFGRNQKFWSRNLTTPKEELLAAVRRDYERIHDG